MIRELNCPECGGTGRRATAASTNGAELARHEKSGTRCGRCQGAGTVCITCGINISGDKSRCTNRRCGSCHGKHCTPGGSTSPGHGYGPTPNPFDEQRKQHVVQDDGAEGAADALDRIENTIEVEEHYGDDS